MTIFGRKFPLFSLAILTCFTVGSAGCNLCCPPYLDDYATVGGKWSRSNPTEGRVGSAFSDPGVVTASAVEFSETVPSGEIMQEYPMNEGIEIVEPEVIVEPGVITLGEGW